MRHPTRSELEAGLPAVRESPKDGGVLELIVRRPAVGEREVVSEVELNVEEGVAGDRWRLRRGAWRPDGASDLETQLTIMNARAAALVGQNRDRWPLAGDQLFIDLDLSGDNLPPGTRLAIGSALIEVTSEPHTACHKFVLHFGIDAKQFVNSPVGRQLSLRGINAKVVQPGIIRVGDLVRKSL